VSYYHVLPTCSSSTGVNCRLSLCSSQRPIRAPPVPVAGRSALRLAMLTRTLRRSLAVLACACALLPSTGAWSAPQEVLEAVYADKLLAQEYYSVSGYAAMDRFAPLTRAEVRTLLGAFLDAAAHGATHPRSWRLC
jgi:hypothetical protein